ncbi:MAG: YfiR family protein, partial [Thermoplasmata archaeon]|nr:YfiR family protein [Thermoplasmata archaeon]
MSTPIPARLASRPRGNWARLAGALSALAAFIALDLGAAEVRAKLTREYDLKAAFLFNFAQFVEWPPGAFPEASSPFVMCILGDDPFGKSLDEIVAHEAIRNRRIVVRRHRDVQEIS